VRRHPDRYGFRLEHLRQPIKDTIEAVEQSDHEAFAARQKMKGKVSQP
jgi:hypothetical protein